LKELKHTKTKRCGEWTIITNEEEVATLLSTEENAHFLPKGNGKQKRSFLFSKRLF